MKNELFENLKELFLPLAALVAVIVLGFVAVPFLFDRIGILQEELAGVRADESVLRSRLQVLNGFATGAQSTSEKMILAFPGENSALSTISQVKLKAALGQVAVSGIKVGKGNTEGNISYADVDFDVQGPLTSTLAFLESLKKSAPVGSVREVKVTGIDESVGKSTITYRVYWSPFPQTIPSILAPLTDFSGEERDIIAALTALEVSGQTAVTANPPQTRTDPFGI